MTKWLKRIRGAVGMGLTWALVWAPVAVLIGFAIDPDGSMDEMWPVIGAYPGFLGGVVFSVVLAIAARRRSLDELSLPRVAAWGAFAGLLVGSLPFLIGESTSEIPAWMLAVVVIGSITGLSAASAAGSLALARMGERRALAGAGMDGDRAIAPSRTWTDVQGDAATVKAGTADPSGTRALRAEAYAAPRAGR